MLGEMLNDESVGQYSVAIRLIGFVAFLPAIVQKSWAPSVATAKGQGKDAYHRRLSRLYQMMFAIFLLQGIPIFFFAQPITTALYGIEFAEAGALLALLAIRLLFANFGLARSVYITNESLFKHSMITGITGCIVNIAANFVLIPPYGARGAIIATILSFFVTIFLLDAIYSRTRENFFLMLTSPLAASRTTVRLIRARVG